MDGGVRCRAVARVIKNDNFRVVRVGDAGKCVLNLDCTRYVLVAMKKWAVLTCEIIGTRTSRCLSCGNFYTRTSDYYY